MSLWFARKSCRVRATVLKENEEKVVVEESFPAKTSPGDGGKGSGGDNEPPESSSSGALERWAIKLEQSVNIFLTVQLISRSLCSCCQTNCRSNVDMVIWNYVLLCFYEICVPTSLFSIRLILEYYWDNYWLNIEEIFFHVYQTHSL